MKKTFRPKTFWGKLGIILNLFFILLLVLRLSVRLIPLPIPSLIPVGLLSFIASLVAIIKRDRSTAAIISLIFGLVLLILTIVIFVLPALFPSQSF